MSIFVKKKRQTANGVKRPGGEMARRRNGLEKNLPGDSTVRKQTGPKEKLRRQTGEENMA